MARSGASRIAGNMETVGLNEVWRPRRNDVAMSPLARILTASANMA